MTKASVKLGEFNLSHANFSFRVICALKFSLCPFWQKQEKIGELLRLLC